MYMFPADKSGLREFIQVANAEVHDTRIAATARYSELHDVKELVTRVKVYPSKTSDSLEILDEQILVLRARRLLADLYDRRGDYDSPRECLIEADESFDALMNAQARALENSDASERLRTLLSSLDGRALINEQAWMGLMLSVNRHRQGMLKTATESVRAIRGAIEQLHGVVEGSGVKLEAEEALQRIELLCRLSYALGRHHQSAGNVREAEPEFSLSLTYCAALSENPRWATYARHQSAMLLIALARVALDQGALERAWRQMAITKVLLWDTTDIINMDYLLFLMGSVLRQQRKLTEAIALLQKTTDRFEAHNHERFFLRSRYELAKALFNNNDFSGAQQTLGRELSAAQPHFAGDQKTRLRWEAGSQVLKARIAHQQGRSELERSDIRTPLELNAMPEAARRDYESARAWADRAMALLPANTSTDIQAQAHAVMAEIHLDTKDYEKALRQCELGLRAGPVDATDLGWLHIIRCDVYYRRNQIGLAYQELDEWTKLKGQVENAYIRSRAANLEAELGRSQRGFYISLDGPDLHYDDLMKKLRYFLVKKVRSLYKNEKLEEQAHLLGVAKQTLLNWRTEMRQAGEPEH